MLGIVVVMLILLFAGFRHPYFIFLFAVTLITLLQIITVRDFVSGFSNEGLLTICVLFAVVKPVQSTGILQIISNKVLIFQNYPRISLIIIMLFVSSLSVFFNNTPIVALFIPIIVDW